MKFKKLNQWYVRNIGSCETSTILKYTEKWKHEQRRQGEISKSENSEMLALYKMRIQANSH